MSWKVRACVVLAGAFMLSGCAGGVESGAAAQSGTNATLPSSTRPSDAPSVTAKISQTGFNYGKVLGTFQIDVEDENGYAAVIDLTIHKPVMYGTAAEMP